MYEASSWLSFDTPPDAAAKAWWPVAFPVGLGLTSHGMADLLTGGGGRDGRVAYAYVDGVAQAFGLRVVGRQGHVGEASFSGRSFHLSGCYYNARGTFVAGSEGPAIALRLTRELLEASRRIGARRVCVDARDFGRYGWVRMGFRPDATSWRTMQGDLIRGLFARRDEVGIDEIHRLVEAVATGRPDAAVALASERAPVRSRTTVEADLRPTNVALGKALFLEACQDWSGEMRVNDSETSFTGWTGDEDRG